MAEVVQRHSENMVKELEDLRQTKLLPEEFVRRILKMRREMESKISGNVTKNVDDYKNYIHHEKLILEKLRKCRDKKKISDKKNSIDYSIMRRIQRLYETALQRFPNDFSLHEGYFKFCKQNGFNSTACQVIENTIKLFSYEAEVWKMAADWYRHMDAEKVAQTLRKGLTVIPGNTSLYSTAIEMELDDLKHAESAEPVKTSDVNKCCDNIHVYVTLMLNNIKNLDFIILILRTLEEHDSTSHIQQLIVAHLFKNHAEEDIVWHTLAVRERNGKHFQTDPNEEPRSGSSTKARIIYCIDKYKQGLTMVTADKKRKLWSHYLETLIDMKENLTSASASRIDLLKEALAEAHKSGYLEERHYSVWLEVIPADEGRRILEESTIMHPQSEKLWKLRMRYAIETDKITLVNTTFKEGVTALREKAIHLWLMVLRFHMLVSEPRTLKSIFEDGIHQPYEISNVIKPRYIEWIAFHEGMEAARQKYKIVAVQKPYCKDLHIQMSKLEFGEIDINNEAWRLVHELACEQFGSEDMDVWVNFLKYVLFNEHENVAEMLTNIQTESKKRLPPFLWEQFKKIYDNLISGSV